MLNAVGREFVSFADQNHAPSPMDVRIEKETDEKSSGQFAGALFINERRRFTP